MVKSCAAIGCTKRQGSRVSFHIFPVSKVRQKQWLASLKLINQPVLKHAVLCSDYFPLATTKGSNNSNKKGLHKGFVLILLTKGN